MRILRLQPRKNFSFLEAPVLSKPVSRKPLSGSLAHSSVNPRDRHVEQIGDFMNCEQLALLSFSSCCGSVTAFFLVVRIQLIGCGGNWPERSARLNLTSLRITHGRRICCEAQAMISWRVWVLARAELGRAGFHLTFSEFPLTFVFSLIFCGHCNTFAILK
jgi:hypothetical protein